MARCYEELANRPLPPWPSRRHHQLKGKKFKQGNGPFWEYGVGGGARVRYKEGRDGAFIVVHAGGTPADTH